jgi:hypothetical protein
MRKYNFRTFENFKDLACHFIARHLPRRIIMWANIHAISGYSCENRSAVVPEIRAMDVVKSIS